MADFDKSPRKLRIAIITENFYPKVDGVTRTLGRLLEHLQIEGHTAVVLGPDSGMATYAGHELIGTKGLPLFGVYKELKLNFIRPRFITRLRTSFHRTPINLSNTAVYSRVQPRRDPIRRSHLALRTVSRPFSGI